MNKKKEIDWKSGIRINEEDYEPVQQVREFGFSKLADGLYADPSLRKTERKRKLTRPVKTEEGKFFIEESESGLHQEYTPSEAARLIQKDAKGLKGVLRFGKSVSQKIKKNT